MKKAARLNGFDDEEWDEEDDELIDEEEGHCPDNLEVEGPSYAPVFTGLLDAHGNPIIRHPVVIRMGFHPERNKYHVPTLEDNGFEEADGKVFGWVYDS
ncbi:hypothetical protein MAL1_00228 [Bacteriophage DSS3_MAL1]|nr:hypothetical protein MAL1_00228 [Bacteriophage DSS3_MAL1]